MGTRPTGPTASNGNAGKTNFDEGGPSLPLDARGGARFSAHMRLICILGMTALAVFPVLNLTAQSIKLVGNSVVDANTLCFTQGTWGIGINGQTFQQDAVTSFKGFQYATYYDSDRRVCVARKSKNAAGWEVIRYNDHQLKGNDAHNVAVLGLCPADGTIHLAFDHHGHPLHYRVSRPDVALKPAKFPWTAGLFGGITNALEPGKTLSRVTYPRFLRTPWGGLQFSCRIGGSGNGDKCLADYDPKARVWKNFGPYLGGQGNYQGDTSRNAYLNGLTYDPRGRLHVTWCWRETPDPMSNHDQCYAFSDDGGLTWFNNLGRAVGRRGVQPLTLVSPDLRVVDIPTHRGLINTTTQAVDRRRRVHLVTFHLPDDAPAPANWEAARKQAQFFHYWRDDDGTWTRNAMDFIGSRPQLWFDAADNAFVIFIGDRFHESPYLSIVAASAKSKWTDWKLVDRETGPFIGQPQLDRYSKPGVLSVYIQEAPKQTGDTASPLHVMSFLAGK